ncbi:MAG: JAB domain-containing protein [Acetobacteraceae bacterium]
MHDSDPRPFDKGRTAAAFPSTGPEGHRGRMREKLLSVGPDSLADYEILEMLLFLGIPRRDTKPLAKATLNRFGSLAATLLAPPADLADLGAQSVAAIKLVAETAERLSHADVVDRPVLSDWQSLVGYLGRFRSRADPERVRVLFLDNRNRLIADEARARDGTDVTMAREVAARALALHATALILVNRPADSVTPPQPYLALAQRLSRAAGVLSLVLHDALVEGAGQWSSLRQAGYLP